MSANSFGWSNNRHGKGVLSLVAITIGSIGLLPARQVHSLPTLSSIPKRLRTSFDQGCNTIQCVTFLAGVNSGFHACVIRPQGWEPVWKKVGELTPSAQRLWPTWVKMPLNEVPTDTKDKMMAKAISRARRAYSIATAAVAPERNCPISLCTGALPVEW